MATKRSNKDGDKRRQEEHGDKRVKVTAPHEMHETVEGI